MYFPVIDICFQVFAATDTEASTPPYMSLNAHR